ncbi:DsbA family protein [Devriesea agamarum]|uniref:DsbA family protein n=1 Tax=Devriesea agamarum TaxID=472569 RepID=UPI00071E2FFD|nr:thioredoxin domain-containing protein [Devriesea agamarum]
MTPPSKGSASESAKDKRAAQREALRQQREAELRRQRRLRTIIITAGVIIALAIVSGIGYAIYRSVEPDKPVTPPPGIAQGASYLELGPGEGSGKPVVDVYVDFMCPACGAFTHASGPDLQKVVANNEATVRFHPRTFLNRMSTTGDFSSRAANAAVCVYADNKANYMKFDELMFANQPPEGSAGLPNKQITDLATQAGAGPKVAECIADGTYIPWVEKVVEVEAQKDTQGTPTILINGKQWKGDFTSPGELGKAIEAARAGA